MFTLVWWNYPLIAVTTIASMLVAYWWVSLQERREEQATGPHPCMTHLGTSPYGFEEWCFQKHGHSGPHDTLYAVDEELQPPHYDH